MRLGYVLAILITLSATPLARAQQPTGGNIDLQYFRPAIDSRGYITVNASQILGHLELSFGLVTNWAYKVLEMDAPRGGLGAEYANGDRTYDVDNLITPNLQAALGIAGLLEIGVTIPFMVVAGDADPDFLGLASDPNDDEEFGFSSQGIGDIGAHAKIRLLNTSKHPVGLAVLGSVYFAPYGEDKHDQWLGEGGMTVQPSVIIDKELG